MTLAASLAYDLVSLVVVIVMTLILTYESFRVRISCQQRYVVSNQFDG
jgi:hypothetical protein